MKIQRSVLTKASLQGLSADERYWAISAMLMENDLATLMSAVLMSGRAESDPNVRNARNSQAMFFAQLLAGKLLEAWNCIRVGFLSVPSYAQVSARLSDDGKSALDELKRYFGQRDNRIRVMRNKLAFHYDRDVLMDSFNDLPDNEEIDLWDGGTFGSTRNNAGYLLTVGCMKHEFKPTDGRQGHKVFLDDVLRMTVCFARYLEELLVALLGDTGSTPMETLEIAEPLDADFHPFPNGAWSKTRAANANGE